jgi:signal transduction histidine kinase
MAYHAHEVPGDLLAKWQDTTNVMADIFEVPAALIMRVLPDQIEVLVSAHKDGNPYEAEERARLDTGLYCETVMETRAMLQVPNALEDAHWKENPDVALNMIAYMGLPLIWPNQEVFGTICVLDSKTRRFQAKYIELMWEIKRGIECDFRLIEQHQQLIDSNAELIGAIREQARANGQLNEALNTLNRTQAQLLQAEKNAALGALVVGVAHELNTPIGNGVMAASTLQDHARRFAARIGPGLSVSQVREYVQTVQEAADILARSLDKASTLVSNFKQVAVDQSSMNRRRFDLAATVAETLTVMGPAVRQSGHQVQSTVPAGIEMQSCPGALTQVLTHLFDNALKHAFVERPSGRVTVSAQRQGEDAIELTVRDNGQGIAPDYLGRIFDPFVTTRLGQGGSGLGLHTAYNLVHTALQGSIEVESRWGEGSCFTLRLPRQLPMDESGTAGT